jgi:hypothetical protein
MKAYFLNTENDSLAYAYKTEDKIEQVYMSKMYKKITGWEYNRIVKASTFMPHYRGRYIETTQIHYSDLETANVRS